LTADINAAVAAVADADLMRSRLLMAAVFIVVLLLMVIALVVLFAVWLDGRPSAPPVNQKSQNRSKRVFPREQC
jgi:hypothetical protein